MSSLICSTRQAALSPRCRRSIPVRAGLQPGPSRRELLLGAGMSAAGLVLPQGGTLGKANPVQGTALLLTSQLLFRPAGS